MIEQGLTRSRGTLIRQSAFESRERIDELIEHVIWAKKEDERGIMNELIEQKARYQLWWGLEFFIIELSEPIMVAILRQCIIVLM